MGSHHILGDDQGRIASVPIHGSKTLPVGPLRRIVRAAGLTVEEFVDSL